MNKKLNRELMGYAEEILQEKDPAKRQKMIADNITLFR